MTNKTDKSRFKD